MSYAPHTYAADTYAPHTYVAHTYAAHTYAAHTYVADTYVADINVILHTCGKWQILSHCTLMVYHIAHLWCSAKNIMSYATETYVTDLLSHQGAQESLVPQPCERGM